MNIKTSLLALTAIGVLSACGSTPQPSETELMAARLAELQEAQKSLHEQQEAMQQAQRNEELEATPHWAINPPNSDATGMFGVGIATSKDLQHGLRASRLQAQFDVAAKYRQELSGSERAISRGNTSGDVMRQETFLIDSLVDAVPVVGYDIVDAKVVPIRGQYHIYTLIKLPYDEFNQVLQAQRAQAENDMIRAEFDDLERRLTARRAERERERQLEHDREIERMETRSRILQEQTQATSQRTEEVQ